MFIKAFNRMGEKVLLNTSFISAIYSAGFEQLAIIVDGERFTINASLLENNDKVNSDLIEWLKNYD